MVVCQQVLPHHSNSQGRQRTPSESSVKREITADPLTWQVIDIPPHQVEFYMSRQPVVGNGTRLVFEIQSTATGQYVSGLTAELEVHAPDGTQRLLPLPEVTGVTAYYETTLAFEQEGEYTLTWRSVAAGVPFSTTFRKAVSRSTLHGDWPTLLGYGTVLAAFLVTWIGLVLSVQRRFAAVWSEPL